MDQNTALMPTKPALPVAPWLGGKRNLARRICAIIDATQCTTYAEPFVGMGGVTTTYSVANHTGAATGRAELLISNWAFST